MLALEYVEKTREYLDYLETHILNVAKAWQHIQKVCKDMRFIYDDYYFETIDLEVKNHDISKFSIEEFVQYRKAFYPTRHERMSEDKFDMSEAWEHHKEKNLHHWESWTKNENSFYDPNEWEVHCVHMVIDWTAMGYKFGDTAQKYYESKKDTIKLPDYAVSFIYEIFERL